MKKPLVVKEWLGYTHVVDPDTNDSLVRVGTTDKNKIEVRVMRAIVEEANKYYRKRGK